MRAVTAFASHIWEHLVRHRWEVRYSSCEMIHLDIAEGDVRIWLDHAPSHASRYAFDDVLAGAADGEIGNVFGADALKELKAAIRDWIANPRKSFDKQADMLRRRREG